MVAKSYKDLNVWQRAVALAVEVYKTTGQFPREEIYGLTSQIRRAVVSIPSNIAEGQARNSPRAFASHLNIALGSIAELETQWMIAQKIGYLSQADFTQHTSELTEITRMIYGPLRKQQEKQS